MRFQSVLFIATVAAVAANASVYEAKYPGYTGGSYGISNGGGEIKSVLTQYASVGKVLYFETKLGNVPGTSQKSDAFTLAISKGPNPKGTPDELALFYFDGTNLNAPKLTVYAYNGQNSASSYRDGNGDGVNDGGDLVASSLVDSSFIKDIFIRNEGGDRVMGFKLDVNGINAHVPAFGNPAEWEGAQFANKFGIWFHPRAGTTAAYNSQGKLTNFSSACEGWLDGSNITTQVVPEPVSAAVLAVGGALLVLRRRAR
ncbi:MAG: PEP-CTERM sorting domain-containing protein [Chthonomonas sp.]|nr:PEP-CTERM sorting domain-containing protein [Chthonomonas sp.]